MTCWHWAVTSAAVAVATYLFLYQQPIRQFAVHAPGVLADMSFNRLSKMAVRWLIIAKYTWRATPYLLIFLSWLGLNAGIVVGFWKLNDGDMSLEAKVGVSVAVLVVYFCMAITLPLLRSGYRQRRPVVLLSSTLGGLLLLAVMGVGVWKLLGSQIQTGGKTIASFALLCYLTLMSLVPSLLLRRKRSARPDVSPDFCSI